ncbi:MAG: T9SS type A sorting domain-containing protein [Flavobacterium sp.]|uniref:DUF7619 domain-containing protein n=1 Tax=Flavobacterium sp. TaxID=239 RepID=UPI0011FD05D1|nr:T9SS type A sorting domain-containing protein [Flavobacterium sp.]RZJ66625.1 MAG: T9SS type A sorting domain-containing protein [Flavobacterium sp.]
MAKDVNGTWVSIDTNSDGQIQVNEAIAIYYLDVSGSWGDSGPGAGNMSGIEAFANLRTLKCRGVTNVINFNISGLANLIEMDCSNITGIQSLDFSGLTQLKKLSCTGNLIQQIDCSDLVQLEELNCGGSGLTSLNISNIPSLKILRYSSSPNLPLPDFSQHSTLEELDCSVNNYVSLDVTMLANLKKLRCGGNGLVSLNMSGLSQLEHLDYSYSPQLPDLALSSWPTLKRIYCKNSGLSQLDLAGLDELEILQCNNNQFASLDLEGKVQLVHLECSNNQLTELDLSDCVSLKRLFCNDNNLTSIDVGNSPEMEVFFANNNNLQSIFAPTMHIITNGISDLMFDGNPDISYICVPESLFAYIDNKLNYYGIENCEVNSYCSFTPLDASYALTGVLRYDYEMNGCDGSDDYANFVRLSLTDGTQTGISLYNQDTFNIPLPAGNHTLTPILENPEYFLVSPSSVSVVFPDEESPLQHDFCISPNGTFPDLEVLLFSRHVCLPGETITYQLLIKNKGTQDQSGTVHLQYDESVLDFVDSDIALATQSAGDLVWDFENLEPFERRLITIKFHLNSPMDTPPLNGGDILNYTATISSTLSDTQLQDNTIVFHETIANSYDPNDKICIEGQVVGPEMAGQYVHYVIRFENTGDANAHNIVVRDVIDTTKYDIETLIPMVSSHNFEFRAINERVEFIFKNIDLPFAPESNNGFIAFKIKTKPTLTVGDTFSNSASIYFDYNFPVVTEPAITVIQTLQTADFEFSEHFVLYPNPSGKEIRIASKDNAALKSISFYNALGQLVLTNVSPQTDATIDVSTLLQGQYYVKVFSEIGTSVTKFLKN